MRARFSNWRGKRLIAEYLLKEQDADLSYQPGALKLSGERSKKNFKGISRAEATQAGPGRRPSLDQQYSLDK
jgi:hypothetical protein